MENMNARTIFRKTLSFVWIKLGLKMLSFFIVIALGGLLFLIGHFISPISGLYAEPSGWITWIVLLLVWLVLGGIISWLLRRYLWFMVRAAHVAVVTEATAGGQLPEGGLVKYGVGKVRQRFVAMNVFFLLNTLVDRAVNQIANLAMRVVGMATSFIPGGDKIQKFVGTFIKIFLGSIVECCMAWTFFMTDKNAFRASLDALVIYFRNWKALMKSAAFTALLVVGLYFVVGLVFFGIFWLAAGTFNPFVIAGIIIGILLTKAFKNAFMDSWIMVKMVNTFMRVAPTTQNEGDTWDKLRKGSRAFRQMEKRANQDDPTGTQGDFMGDGGGFQNPTEAPQPMPAQENRFCPDTGRPL